MTEIDRTKSDWKKKLKGIDRTHRPHLLKIRDAETVRGWKEPIDTTPHNQYAIHLRGRGQLERSEFIAAQCRMYDRTEKVSRGVYQRLRDALFDLDDANYGSNDAMFVYRVLYPVTRAEALRNRLIMTGMVAGSTQFRRSLMHELKTDCEFVRGFHGHDDYIRWNPEMSFRDVASAMSVHWGAGVKLRYQPIGYGNQWYVTTYFNEGYDRWMSKPLPPEAFEMFGDVVKSEQIKCEYVKKIDRLRHRYRFVDFTKGKKPSGYLFKTKVSAHRAIARLQVYAANLINEYLSPGVPVVVEAECW